MSVTAATPVRVLRAAGTAGTLAALALTAHTLVNRHRLRRLARHPRPARERVSVLVPARDEARRIGPTIDSLLAQQGVPDLEILVLDDASQDGTADVVRARADGDPRITVLTGSPLPAGWLGKPHACAQLSAASTGSVLCFIDADVTLAPTAVAAATEVLRSSRLAAISPYPQQLADGLGPRLVQPLIEWSWLTTLPLGIAERSPRPSLSAATGQFFVVDRDAYLAAGGHGAVASAVLDDVGLLRAIKRSGGRGVAVDGSTHAQCRMYESWADLHQGYTKSLWTAFGGRAGAAGVVAALTLTYVVPPLSALLTGSWVAWVGYGAGVLGRVVVARETGQRVLPDVLAHPVSIAVFDYLVIESWRRRRRGALTWKGRPVG